MTEPRASEPIGERLISAIGNGIRRTITAWRALDRDQRIAAVAAIALFASLFLPWFQVSGIDVKGRPVSIDLDGFEAFTFVEASILVVAAGVIVLLFGRGEGRQFQLPGGDGTVIATGGGWVMVLLGIRYGFYKPTHVFVDTGISLGIFVAAAAAVALMLVGFRMRVRHHAQGKADVAVEPDPAPVDPPSWALDAHRRRPPEADPSLRADAGRERPDERTAEQLSIPIDRPDDPDGQEPEAR